jgi:Tol biopolymer transport system component
MRRKLILTALVLTASAAAARFTLEQVMSAPFPSEVTACHTAGKVAWVLDENGARNIWVAEAPDYKGRRLTKFTADDGQEIAQMSWTPDAKSIVYVRGGDFETHRDNPNPASSPDAVEQAIWIMPLSGEPARKISEGNEPMISPQGDRMVFLKGGQIWSAALAADAKPAQLIHAKGRPGMVQWSPDGSRIVFINNRGDHAIVGAYDFGSKKLWYIDPSVDSDTSPVLSPDGKQVAFIRIGVVTRPFRFGPVRGAETPWSIRLADVESGNGR